MSVSGKEASVLICTTSQLLAVRSSPADVPCPLLLAPSPTSPVPISSCFLYNLFPTPASTPVYSPTGHHTCPLTSVPYTCPPYLFYISPPCFPPHLSIPVLPPLIPKAVSVSTYPWYCRSSCSTCWTISLGVIPARMSWDHLTRP